MRRILPLCLFLLLPPALLPNLARAAESNIVASARDRVSLISDTDHVAPGVPFHIGLHFHLAPGWHTYWRNPGDAGVAADIKLTLPPGAKAGPIAWPTPARIAEGPVMTYAYIGAPLLMQRITPGAAGQGMTVAAHADWLVCKDICVPESGDFTLTLQAGTPAPSAQAPLFAAAGAALPHRDLPWQARIDPHGVLAVTGPGLGAQTVKAAWFIPDAPNSIVNDAPQPLRLAPQGIALALKPGGGLHAGGDLSGILVVTDRGGGETAAAIRATPGAFAWSNAAAGDGSAANAPGADAPGALRLLGLAFLGGLILNLMPCVFPVLAMKAMGLLSGKDARQRRAQAASYTLGVLAAFLALALVLLAARAGGGALGWGFQFQSPAFVAAMAWVIFAVGLNLSGVFAMGEGALGLRMAGLGQGLAGRGGHVGSFFTGLLAVLVATPCTAPFMGVAIAGALAAPAAVLLGVFVALGLGLAAPYALLACLPGLARILPRPGAWMDYLRQMLAFPMYGATVWLLWVASEESGSSGVLSVASGLVLVGFAAWLLGLMQHHPGQRRLRRGTQAMLAATLLAAAGILSALRPTPAPATAQTADGFSPARLAALRAAGKPVLVDISAAWCVSCLVNEHVALDRPAVQAALHQGGITLLRGDWTRQDPTITRFLRAHGQDGVPLYLFYPKGGGAAVKLPQILTEAGVLGILRG
ncbi:MAG: thioredoxin family protein [Rhodospirillales bacterium]|nr:thioredoxin family protein [Rhodospirillales bacterium]